jgi:hypothetical protein
MCVAVRKQQHIAGFETKRMPAAPFQQASSRRHDVELRPARWLGIAWDVPLRSEPADCLEFRPDAEQRCDGVEGVLSARRRGLLSIIDPISKISAPLGHSSLHAASHLLTRDRSSTCT